MIGMPRLVQIVAPGLPHHLMARGNWPGDIFEDGIDCAQGLVFDNLDQEEKLRASTERVRPVGGGGVFRNRNSFLAGRWQPANDAGQGKSGLRR